MLLLSLIACGTAPDLSTMEEALGAVVPISYVAAHSWGWQTGAMIDGCDVAAGVDGTWAGEVTIGESCPIPAIGEASGVIGLSGHLDEKGGALAAEFTRTEGLRIDTVAAFGVTPDQELLRVLFAGGDIGMVDSAVELAEVGLTTLVDVGDPSDGSDDVYTIDGGVQVLSAAGGSTNEARTDQVSFVRVVVRADCGKNPVGGHMIAQQADAKSGAAGAGGLIEDLFVTFDEDCDGTAEILADAGVNAASSGTSVAFNLGR